MQKMIKKTKTSIRFKSSSSYPIYPTHRNYGQGLGGKKMATHTQKGECSQRVP